MACGERVQVEKVTRIHFGESDDHTPFQRNTFNHLFRVEKNAETKIIPNSLFVKCIVRLSSNSYCKQMLYICNSADTCIYV